MCRIWTEQQGIMGGRRQESSSISQCWDDNRIMHNHNISQPASTWDMFRFFSIFFAHIFVHCILSSIDPPWDLHQRVTCLWHQSQVSISLDGILQGAAADTALAAERFLELCRDHSWWDHFRSWWPYVWWILHHGFRWRMWRFSKTNQAIEDVDWIAGILLRCLKHL